MRPRLLLLRSQCGRRNFQRSREKKAKNKRKRIGKNFINERRLKEEGVGKGKVFRTKNVVEGRVVCRSQLHSHVAIVYSNDIVVHHSLIPASSIASLPRSWPGGAVLEKEEEM